MMRKLHGKECLQCEFIKLVSQRLTNYDLIIFI